jgi:hypothetical protein
LQKRQAQSKQKQHRDLAKKKIEDEKAGIAAKRQKRKDSRKQ